MGGSRLDPSLALIVREIPAGPRIDRPVGAVLDYFKRDDVTLIGISLGGTFGGGLSGAGAEATNVILTKTNAYIEASDIVANDDSDGIADVCVSASNTSATATMRASSGISLPRRPSG